MRGPRGVLARDPRRVFTRSTRGTCGVREGCSRGSPRQLKRNTTEGGTSRRPARDRAGSGGAGHSLTGEHGRVESGSGGVFSRTSAAARRAAAGGGRVSVGPQDRSAYGSGRGAVPVGSPNRAESGSGWRARLSRLANPRGKRQRGASPGSISRAASGSEGRPPAQ